MHTFITILMFVAMILSPCLVALHTGIGFLQEESEYPDEHSNFIPD